MKFLKGLDQISLLPERVIATIGNFDGVHRGHQALLASLCAQAKRLQAPVLVILFEPQPSEYFYQQGAPARLTSLREKLKILSALGVDYVCCLKFNAFLSQMPAIDFAEKIIFNSLHANYLLVGCDFRFGQNRLGDVEMLTLLGQKQGVVVEAFPDVVTHDGRISSTGIRKALQQGDLGYAAACLGRSYSMCGRVVHGAGLGRQFGIPTANIALNRKISPLSGVFNVEVRREKGSLIRGVANIGRRPTIDGHLKLTLEVHLFDFKESIYGEMLEVIFLSKLRDEKKFNSVDELIAQINQDIALSKDSIQTT